MHSNNICSSRQLFILFYDMMKTQYPKEDIQGAYIQALRLISNSISNRIKSMIYGKD